MDQWQCCRTCLSVLYLYPIFPDAEHHEKYSEVVLEATGVKISMNDSLPQQMCSSCINLTNEMYKFRKKCQETQKSLSERIVHPKPLHEVKIEGNNVPAKHFIDISDLTNQQSIDDFDAYDNITLNNYNLLNDNTTEVTKEVMNKPEKCTKLKEKSPVKRTLRVRKSDKEKKPKIREKEEIECEYCHKILTSKLSLRNHYKIHTGFDVVCEHCGKKFITRRLLLMHCKAKHGYEKTDKCSFCDYRASNAEQVKIHERLHTGEKPYICAQCGAGFHRKSSYLQHVAIHLPEKTVQCTQCPARFKSVTLMRIHANRHRATQYTYRCGVCAHSFARRRNVARHLLRIHALQPAPEHIERTKCT